MPQKMGPPSFSEQWVVLSLPFLDISFLIDETKVLHKISQVPESPQSCGSG